MEYDDMLSTSLSRRGADDVFTTQFTERMFTVEGITKKLKEIGKGNISDDEKSLIEDTLKYFKEVSKSYSSKSGKILHNLYSQIEVCKQIFLYIDKKKPSMLKAVFKSSDKITQYQILDPNIFKNLEVLKEEMKVLVASEKVEILVNLLNRFKFKENKEFIIYLIRERIKESQIEMKKLKTKKNFTILLGIIEEIGIFKEPFTDDYYKKLTDYVKNECAMPLEIFKMEELSILFDKLTNLLHNSLKTSPPELCKIVILLIELNNIFELDIFDDKNGNKHRYFKTQLSEFLNLVKNNADSTKIIIACKNNHRYLNNDFEKVIYTIDNLKTMKLSIEDLNELISYRILHVLNLKGLKDSITDNGTKGYLTSDDFVKLCSKIDAITLKYVLSVNKSKNLLSLDEILTLLKNRVLTVEMFNRNSILTDDEYIELKKLYNTKRDLNDDKYDRVFLSKIVEIINNRYDYNLFTKITNVYTNISNIINKKTLYEKITSKELNILRLKYKEDDENYFKHLKFLDNNIMKKIKEILDLETDLKESSSEESSSEESYSEELSSGGRKVLSVKKEICGKLRCIYKIPGSRKEHIKYKRRLITVTEYKKLMKAKS